MPTENNAAPAIKNTNDRASRLTNKSVAGKGNGGNSRIRLRSFSD
jgi:hypothetical protein